MKPQAAKPKAAAVPSPAAATTAATKPAAAARNNGANGNQRGQQQRSSKPVNADRELNAEVPAAGDLKEDRGESGGFFLQVFPPVVQVTRQSGTSDGVMAYNCSGN